MIEKVNPAHPDKVADRIAGAIVDLVYALIIQIVWGVHKHDASNTRYKQYILSAPDKFFRFKH